MLIIKIQSQNIDTFPKYTYSYWADRNDFTFIDTNMLWKKLLIGILYLNPID